MYAFPSGKKVNVKYCDSSSDEEDSKKTSKRKSKKDKKKKKTNARCSGALLYPSGPMPMRFPPGVAPIYVAPQPPRPIFAAHIQMNPVVQPVPCPMIAVTHTQLYPRPAMPSFGPPPSTTYVLQAVNQAPAAVPMAMTASAIPAAGVYSSGVYSSGQSPFMYPIYTG